MKITIQKGNKEWQIISQKEHSLLQSLTDNHIALPSDCAGNGTCGKCKVRFLEGQTEPTQEDIKVFSKEELESGLRLSCKSYLDADCTIALNEDVTEQMEVISEYINTSAEINDKKKRIYGIGIDIGTTTIAMQLVELSEGMPIQTYTAINSQKQYGTDVISRMKASNEGKKEVLRNCIRKDLAKGITFLLQNFASPIEKIVIAGNTTMIHLLMGYSCETLGVFPFTPINIETIETTYQNLIGEEAYDIPISILPGISAFVGGDITAGLLACEFFTKEKAVLLIDLGTNGEMAIGNKEKIVVTSTAAGPAFEGGNILHGMGSVPGAVCSIEIEGTTPHIKTIADKTPIGICGTGVVETTYELLKNKIVDETGLLEEAYFEEGFLLAQKADETPIVFTQKDIREMQLAKAAIHAGIETLLLNYPITYEEIDKVYLAGGFGYRLDLKKAAGIGLLPKALLEKTVTIGNSSLNGTICYLTKKEADSHMKKIIAAAKEINLSNDEAFEKSYMNAMYFKAE